MRQRVAQVLRDRQRRRGLRLDEGLEEGIESLMAFGVALIGLLRVLLDAIAQACRWSVGHVVAELCKCQEYTSVSRGMLRRARRTQGPAGEHTNTAHHLQRSVWSAWRPTQSLHGGRSA